jgi:hypothetical protein
MATQQPKPRAKELTPAEAARSPLIRKIKSLDEFQPNRQAIDQATAVNEEALLTEIRRRLRVK